MPSVSGCDGRCCAVFTYPARPSVLRDRAERGVGTERQIRDDLFIADMLVSLTPEEANARAREFEIDDKFDLVELAARGQDYYTCRHWDEETRRCGAYEDRPMMCADYPYQATCEHCDCKAPAYTAVKWAGFRVESYRPTRKLLEAGDA